MAPNRGAKSGPLVIADGACEHDAVGSAHRPVRGASAERLSAEPKAQLGRRYDREGPAVRPAPYPAVSGRSTRGDGRVHRLLSEATASRGRSWSLDGAKGRWSPCVRGFAVSAIASADVRRSLRHAQSSRFARADDRGYPPLLLPRDATERRGCYLPSPHD